ncbi:hypothetical protein JXA34_03115 [Patescibacteria group bacterium]|nr:hypothetical protein [Patescibacteria group bacterium]
MIKLLQIDKRQRFLFHTAIACMFIYLVFSTFMLSTFRLLVAVIVFTLINVVLAHYPNIGVRNVHMASLLPASLLLGSVIFLRSFPNFTYIFQLISILGCGVLYYLILLSDNIFLVVSDKDELIPLYRVAITWSQILSSLVSIPLYVGLFKIPINSVYHALLVGFIGYFMCMYQIWSLKLDVEAKRIRVGEEILLSALVFFMVSSVSIGLSFFPSEAFLRALVVSSVLMYGLSYVNAHLKNNITKKYIFQNISTVFLFVILALLFHS